MNQQQIKKNIAHEVVEWIKKEYQNQDIVLGIGTGSTVNALISQLDEVQAYIKYCVSSSEQTTKLLLQQGFEVEDVNNTDVIDLYLDGADEINPYYEMIKGGGGALTQEKIVASQAKCFVCMVDESKLVKRLGTFPLPIEVLPVARSCVARELVKHFDVQIQYRANFVTDNDNVILDVFYLNLDIPDQIEQHINNIPGVVTNGIFSKRPADVVFVGYSDGEVRIDFKGDLNNHFFK